MKFALVDNKKVEAAKGLNGICQLCQEPVIPKCGQFRVNHWAHKSCTHCDKWWENETEWHRNWKNHFPEEWQEVVAFDEKTGEKHIADIKTNAGMVIEFQHSYLKEEERISRENFYKDMIWVVDGTRRKSDYIKFSTAFTYHNLYYSKGDSIWILESGYEHLPKEWMNSSFPVIFDFKGNNDDSKENDLVKEYMWCLLPIRWRNFNVFWVLTKKELIEYIQKGGIIFNYNEIKAAAYKMIGAILYQRRLGIH